MPSSLVRTRVTAPEQPPQLMATSNSYLDPVIVRVYVRVVYVCVCVCGCVGGERVEWMRCDAVDGRADEGLNGSSLRALRVGGWVLLYLWIWLVLSWGALVYKHRREGRVGRVWVCVHNGVRIIAQSCSRWGDG